MSEDINFENMDIHIKPKRRSEVKDIVIAWVAISLCFALVLGGYNLFRFNNIVNISIVDFLILLFVSLIVTGTAFILHELAHKYSAIYFGAKAQFVKWNAPLIFAIFFAFLVGFVFAAPGAVYIFGKKFTRKENGLVSLAGPFTNIILAGLFFLLYTIIQTQNPIVLMIFDFGIVINLWIAFFNLLPIGPLDGKAIFLWNPFIWVLFMIISLGGYFLFIGII